MKVWQYWQYKYASMNMNAQIITKLITFYHYYTGRTGEQGERQNYINSNRECPEN
jgi:hypothetical protein